MPLIVEPKALVSSPLVEFHLSRRAEATWSSVVRPWLERGRGTLERAYVIVATRGQAHAFKQRCLEENLALLGIEFLTPGLARKKWMAGVDAGAPAVLKVPALGRELLLTLLRTLVDRRLCAVGADDPAWGFWKSVSSDTERLLEDFDDLLKAGLSPEQFPDGPLRLLFAEWLGWIEKAGYTVAPLQSRIAATQPLNSSDAFGRVLVLASGPEGWGEFFSIAAFLKRARAISVVLPEPAFSESKGIDENWISLWESLLGAEPVVLDVPEASDCSGVGTLWARSDGSAAKAEIVIGRSRSDEMALVADKIAALLGQGASNLAVVFPAADAAHARLARILGRRGIAFVDALEGAGTAPIDLLLQRALLSFYSQGCRFEELLDLWPFLVALNLVDTSTGDARKVLERLFDEFQVHSLAVVQGRLAGLASSEGKEVARVVGQLLPPWKDSFGFGYALDRFRTVCEGLQLLFPIEWSALDRFAQNEPGEFPAAIAFAALESFLPEKGPVSKPAGKGLFARVTLTTRRRASGVSWSHVIFTESNAGIWPARRESSSWLNDEQRRLLNEAGSFSLALFTADDRSEIERQALLQLAADAGEGVVFSAALADDEDRELPLAPNAWLERVLLAKGLDLSQGGLEGAFARFARSAPPALEADPALAEWTQIWNRRRDPTAAFDTYFLGDPAPASRPEHLAARQIERGVGDPAELWFDAVLGLRRVPFEAFVRSYRRSLGQQAHQLLALALSGEAEEEGFHRMPQAADAQGVLGKGIEALRAAAPENRYWASYLAELSAVTHELLEQVYRLQAGPFVRTELKLPKDAKIPMGSLGPYTVQGRMDLVLLDRPRWQGATVDIIDFKTGGDDPLSAKRMAEKGDSLQLGIYLAAARSRHIAQGRVWMLKPGKEPQALDVGELDQALAQLTRIAEHLSSGQYGALTADRTEFTHPFEWPLACAPIKHAILREKYALTFGEVAEEDRADA